MTASKGRGLLVAVGYPAAALVAVVAELRVGGASGIASYPIVSLICLASLAERIDIVVAPRTKVSMTAGFIAAAALIGGPLAGVLAGAAAEVFSGSGVWRKRLTWAGAGALEGFGIGIAGAHLTVNYGTGTTLLIAAVGLATGLTINLVNTALVGFDRGVDLRSELKALWRPTVLAWAVPWPAVSAAILLYQRAPAVAVSLAAGLLCALWLEKRLRTRLEDRLAEEHLRSRHDALTGAPNRYALTEALGTEHARIMRGGRPGAVLFIDLDRFKAVNDIGYSVGDAVLTGVYQRLRTHLRASDQVARWGGEEWVVILPDEPNLLAAADRLRRLLKHEPFSAEGHEITITGSVGAARLDETRTPDTSLALASRLVKVAKERRDAIEVEESPAPAAKAGVAYRGVPSAL